MTYVSVSKLVDVDIDVDLSEIDTDDLVNELESRALDIPHADERAIPKIFEALYVGNESQALELVRSFVQSATGRVLP